MHANTNFYHQYPEHYSFLKCFSLNCQLDPATAAKFVANSTCPESPLSRGLMLQVPFYV